jgi:hypothetical protein
MLGGGTANTEAPRLERSDHVEGRGKPLWAWAWPWAQRNADQVRGQGCAKCNRKLMGS